MGYVKVKASLGDPKRMRAKDVELLVDTGSYYTVIPPRLADELRIKPVAEAEVVLADKRMVKIALSYAYIKLLDREGVLPVGIMDVPEPIVGVTALEGLDVKVDPATGRFEYSRPYGLALL